MFGAHHSAGQADMLFQYFAIIIITIIVTTFLGR
jgi:hypothetical protein